MVNFPGSGSLYDQTVGDRNLGCGHPWPARERPNNKAMTGIMRAGPGEFINRIA